MQTAMNLTDINIGKAYRVSGFRQSTSEYAEKLYKMGFVEGTVVKLAPIKMSDPLVVQIRGSRIALRRKEAQEIIVKEL